MQQILRRLMVGKLIVHAEVEWRLRRREGIFRPLLAGVMRKLTSIKGSSFTRWTASRAVRRLGRVVSSSNTTGCFPIRRFADRRPDEMYLGTGDAVQQSLDGTRGRRPPARAEADKWRPAERRTADFLAQRDIAEHLVKIREYRPRGCSPRSKRLASARVDHSALTPSRSANCRDASGSLAAKLHGSVVNDSGFAAAAIGMIDRCRSLRNRDDRRRRNRSRRHLPRPNSGSASSRTSASSLVFL